MKLLIGYSLFLLLIATSGTLLVQDSGASVGAERVRGLLNLPERQEAVYSSPGTGSPMLATILVQRSDDQILDARVEVRSSAGVESSKLPTAEVDYEEPALIVHEHRGDWFRVQLANQTGWVQRPPQSSDFAPYPEMLTDRLTFLSEDWDRRIFAEPASLNTARSLPPEWKNSGVRELPVVYLGSRTVNNELWIHVRIDAAASCALDGKDFPPVDGWLPAYQASGKTTAWFYSRGC